MKQVYRLVFAAFIVLDTVISSPAQTIIPLYEKNKVPNSKTATILADTFSFKSGYSGKDTQIVIPRTIMPTLTIFPASSRNATDISVIICSGGSYQGVADEVEGFPAAKQFAAQGITSFVLHYRVPKSDLMIDKEIGPMQDVQTALIYVRERAAKYHINIHHVGIMGFSAGGHLVSTAGTHFSRAYIPNPRKINLRPDFLVLVYPVVSFADSLTHLLSRSNLIGPEITAEKIKEYSNELHVTAQTPPTFLVHAIDDYGVLVQNSLYFFAALEQCRVPANLFLYAHGGHGFGVHNRTAITQWVTPAIDWIKHDGIFSQTHSFKNNDD